MAPSAFAILGEESAPLLARRSIGDNLVQHAWFEFALPVAATIGVAARIGLRWRHKIPLRWDDFTIVVALFFSYGLWATWLYTCQHVIHAPTFSQMPLEYIQDFAKVSLALELIYSNGCNVIKLSIILFYLRAFGSSKSARRVLYVYLAFLVAYTLARDLSTLFECTPIAYLWKKFTPGAKGHCIDFRILFISLAVLNLLTDVAVLVFPMPIVWNLRIPLARKLAICVVFCFGALACIAGVLRLYYVDVIFSGDSTSLLADDAAPKLVICALVEMNIGIITASIPAIRTPLVSIAESLGLTRLWRRSEKNSSSNSPLPPVQASARPKHDSLTEFASFTDTKTYSVTTETLVKPSITSEGQTTLVTTTSAEEQV